MSETSTDKIVPLSVFKSLVALAATIRKKVASSNGELGKRIKDSVEGQNLHAGAFGMLCRLDRMPEDKRNEFIRNLDIYVEWGNEHLWSGDHMGDLDEMAKNPSAADIKADADEAASKVNAARLESGIRPLDPDEAGQDRAANVTAIGAGKGKGNGVGGGKGKLQ